jgi:hypothetical protein
LKQSDVREGHYYWIRYGTWKKVEPAEFDCGMWRLCGGDCPIGDWDPDWPTVEILDEIIPPEVS